MYCTCKIIIARSCFRFNRNFVTELLNLCNIYCIIFLDKSQKGNTKALGLEKEELEKQKKIAIFKSAAEASRQTNISSAQIRKVCQNKGLTAGGYKWQYNE